MASDDKRKNSSGRVTPKKGSEPAAGSERPSMLPKRIGPFSRPDKNAPLGQVGRRPSSPLFLGAGTLIYVVSGVLAFFIISGSLGVILGVVLIGLGVLWLRGAMTAYLRQNKPSSDS